VGDDHEAFFQGVTVDDVVVQIILEEVERSNLSVGDPIFLNGRVEATPSGQRSLSRKNMSKESC